MHHIDQLFAAMSAVTAISDSQWQVTAPGLPDDWGQGRTAFGGISAAMVHYALSMIVAPDRVLRTFHTNFLGPVVFDDPFEVVKEQLRSGRNMSQYLVRLNQAGKVSVCVQACYGVELTSKLHINKLPSHQFELPDKATLIGTDADKLPRFFSSLRSGYAHTEAKIWDEQERLVALRQQAVVVFRKRPDTMRITMLLTPLD
ncbi:MAG: acyl-CoA thioesterase domain-containing protein [Pseudomonadota bacterium]|nr:acyl-CoA thioesterase domain-containing protein [Pseudomonadota bacterium]